MNFNTNENMEDTFIVLLGRAKFLMCRYKLGIVDNSFFHQQILIELMCEMSKSMWLEILL